MAKSHLTLRQLEIFLAVVEQGSFRRAGEAMNLAPVVIGEHMRTLEGRLGGALFERRSGSKPTMTDLGERVLARTHEVMAAVDRLETEAAAQQPQVQWRFGFLPFMVRHLAGRITELRRRFPDSTIMTDIRDQDTRRIFDQVASGELDLAMTVTTERDFRHVPAAVDVRVVIDEPLALFVSHRHPLAARRHVPISALLDYPVALLPHPHPLRAVVDHVLDCAGLTPRKVELETEDYDHLLSHISQSSSIGCLFAEVASTDAVAHRLQALDLEHELLSPQAILMLSRSGLTDRRLSMAAEFLSNHYRFNVTAARASSFSV